MLFSQCVFPAGLSPGCFCKAFSYVNEKRLPRLLAFFTNKVFSLKTVIEL
jgi:hypothetical protein